MIPNRQDEEVAVQREMSESGCGGRAPSTQGPRLYCVVWGPLASVSGRCEAAHASPSVFTRLHIWGHRGQGRDAWAAAGAGTVLADLIPKRMVLYGPHRPSSQERTGPTPTPRKLLAREELKSMERAAMGPSLSSADF